MTLRNRCDKTSVTNINSLNNCNCDWYFFVIEAFCFKFEWKLDLEKQDPLPTFFSHFLQKFDQGNPKKKNQSAFHLLPISLSLKIPTSFLAAHHSKSFYGGTEAFSLDQINNTLEFLPQDWLIEASAPKKQLFNGVPLGIEGITVPGGESLLHF